MLLGCIKSFVERWSGKKTNWSATMPGAHETVDINDDSIKWSASINFMGTAMEFGGHNACALQNTVLGPATKQLAVWAWLPLGKRMNAFKAAIETSLMWLVSTWHLTEAQIERRQILGTQRGSSGDRSSSVPVREQGNFLATPSQRGTVVAYKTSTWTRVAAYRLEVHRLAAHIAGMTDSARKWPC